MANILDYQIFSLNLRCKTKEATMRRKKETPGGRFAKHMAETFKKELKLRKTPKYLFYRQNAVLISASTFNRMLDGESGANVCLVADVADALGYELKLVKKENENQNEQDNETND